VKIILFIIIIIIFIIKIIILNLPDPSLSGYGCNIKLKSLGPLLNAKSKSLGSEC
jgi:hypothetical protein